MKMTYFRVGAAQAAILALAGLGQLASAEPSPGCGTPSAITSGTYSLNVNGRDREYIVELPEGYDSNTPYRLVFTFHALGGSHTQIAEGGFGVPPYYGLPDLAAGTAIFVSPNGIDQGWANLGGEDVAFVDAIIETIEADLCIEQDLRFATGFSYGGAISHALACARADDFRAVAILSSGLLSGCEGGNDPIAVYQQHGNNDWLLPASGAVPMRDRFVANNGCNPLTSEPAAPAGGAFRVDFEGCSDGYPVTWVIFDGEHDPAPTDNGYAFTPDYTWEFFSQFE